MCLLKPNKIAMQKQGLLAAVLMVSVLGFGQVDSYLAGRACMSQQLYDSAVFHLEKALKQNSGDTDIHMQLGISYYELNKFPAARENFYEVEKRRQGMGSFYLAKTEVKLNHPEQALKYLRIHLSSRYKKPEHIVLLDNELSTLEGSNGWQQLWNEKKWYNSADKQYQEAMFLNDRGDHLRPSTC